MIDAIKIGNSTTAVRTRATDGGIFARIELAFGFGV